MQLTTIKFYGVHGIVAVIAIACILMNGPMREGLPLDTSLQERVVAIAELGWLWTLSWCVWMLSALGLFVFCAIFADELKPTVSRNIALAFAAMGIAPDLIAEVIYAFVIPLIIQRQIDIAIVEVMEILAMHLTGFLGNGLYNLGGLLLTVIAAKERIIQGWVTIWGGSAWVLGLMLSASIALGAMQAAEILTASSMVLSTLWMLIFAHKVLKR